MGGELLWPCLLLPKKIKEMSQKSTKNVRMSFTVVRNSSIANNVY